MRIRLTDVDGNVMVAKLPHPQCDHVVIEGAKCPVCGLAPFKVRGLGRSREGHDSWIADAICIGCGKPAGRLRATVSTIFGIEEDEAVLNGRCRVY